MKLKRRSSLGNSVRRGRSSKPLIGWRRPIVAVTITFSCTFTGPVVVLKLPTTAPAGTVIDGGTVAEALSVESRSEVGTVGAGLMLNAQFADAPGVTLEGEHVKAVIRGGYRRLSIALT